jgi:hypothetical protein
VSFASKATEEAVKEWIDRVNKIGYGNMDSRTISELKARDVNYVVVVGGRNIVTEDKCTFKYGFEASFDVHSIGTREFVSDRQFVKLLPAPRDKYLNLSIDYEQKKIVLRTQDFPVCLGDVKANATSLSSNAYLEWSQTAGCIRANSSKTLNVPTSGVYAIRGIREGYIDLDPTNSCDSFSVDNVSFRDLFFSGGSGGGSGLPQGAEVRGCGCWGPAMLGSQVSAQGCASGAATIVGCNAFCGGGVAYAVLCL